MGTESVSWPPEFADFKKFDTILKCGICYEYMTNSMMTSCAHNFCSLCIRKFLVYKNTCPTCFMMVLERDLRNNRPLDDIIFVYAKLRDKLIRSLRIASVPVPQNEPLTPKFENAESPVSVKKVTTKKVAVQLFKKEHKVDDDVVVNGIKIPGIFNSTRTFPKPKKPGEFTECPVCTVDVPTKNINLHLDSCLAIDNGAKPIKTKDKEKIKPLPLPKRLYYLMSDKTLREFMKNYGLNTLGDRKTLLWRAQRFTVAYNSECDSLNPKSVAEIAQQVEREEREEKKLNPLMKSFMASKIVVNRNDSPEKIEKANKAYRDENKDSFKKLIEAMREREGRNIKPLKPPSRVDSDDDDVTPENFDPDKPSTSKAPSSPHSIYSQATVISSDSDSDVFDNSIKKISPQKRRFVPKMPEASPKKIDWNKTLAMEETQIEDDIPHDIVSNMPETSPKKIFRNKSLMEETLSEDDLPENIVSTSEDSDDKVMATINDSDEEPKDLTLDSDDSESLASFNPEQHTPRLTRSRARKQSDEVSNVITDTSKGLKRKRNTFSKSMEQVFDDCFENNSDNKLDADVEDDDSSLIQNLLEGSEWKTPRRTTRKKAQSEKKPTESRKKFKRGRSPAF